MDVDVADDGLGQIRGMLNQKARVLFHGQGNFDMLRDFLIPRPAVSLFKMSALQQEAPSRSVPA